MAGSRCPTIPMAFAADAWLRKSTLDHEMMFILERLH